MEMMHLKSEEDSQETDQNGQCVSGDSNYFGCNDGSSNSIDTNEQGVPGMGFPVIISNDNIYVRDGNRDLLLLVLIKPFQP